MWAETAGVGDSDMECNGLERLLAEKSVGKGMWTRHSPTEKKRERERERLRACCGQVRRRSGSESVSGRT